MPPNSPTNRPPIGTISPNRIPSGSNSRPQILTDLDRDVGHSADGGRPAPRGQSPQTRWDLPALPPPGLIDARLHLRELPLLHGLFGVLREMDLIVDVIDPLDGDPMMLPIGTVVFR